DGIRDKLVTGVQTCALPISRWRCEQIAEPEESDEPRRESRPPTGLAPSAGCPGSPTGDACVVALMACDVTDLGRPELSALDRLEIGRASCRERVEISVVSGG